MVPTTIDGPFLVGLVSGPSWSCRSVGSPPPS